MAKKISSFLGFSKKYAPVVWALVCFAGLFVWNILLVLTSPLWYTVWLIANPEGAARYVLSEKDDRIRSVGQFTYAYVHNIFVCKVMYVLWLPIWAIMPMTLRSEFIFYNIYYRRKLLQEYSTSTQVKYFLSLAEEDKIELLNNSKLSSEAKEEIWNLLSKDKFRRLHHKHDERKYFFLAGIPLSKKQLKDFICYDSDERLLRMYFSKFTPSTEMIRFLMPQAGIGGFGEMMLDFLRKQRPTQEIIDIYMSSKWADLKEKALAIIEGYLDIDAVQQTLDGLNTESDDEKKKILERWSNYCANKDCIAVGAQKKLTFELYKIMVKHGCHLSPKGICALCARFKEQDEKFLHSVLKNEFQLINEEVMTVLKGEYWKYSVYLEVKKELK